MWPSYTVKCALPFHLFTIFNLAAAVPAAAPSSLLSATTTISTTTTSTATPLPLIIWHGLGDTYDAPGLASLATLAAETNPGTQVYIIRISNTSSLDRRAGFFGNMTTQLSSVCDAISTHPLLSHPSTLASGVNALGISQGGPYLRGYVERCNTPPVRTLLTIGSPHNGISRFSKCKPTDWLCASFQALLAANTWSAFSQGNLVPAQYYRDPEDLASYLNYSNYLADINNERPWSRNEAYRKNIAGLGKFVMFGFDEDTTVIPRQSAVFADVNATSGEVTPLRERRIYKEDWLGLKELDERGGLKTEMLPGKHLEIPEEEVRKMFKEYFGPVARNETESSALAGVSLHDSIAVAEGTTSQVVIKPMALPWEWIDL